MPLVFAEGAWRVMWIYGLEGGKERLSASPRILNTLATGRKISTHYYRFQCPTWREAMNISAAFYMEIETQTRLLVLNQWHFPLYAKEAAQGSS